MARQRRRGVRRVLVGAFVVLIAILGCLAWAGVQALRGARDLQAGADELQAAQAGLGSGAQSAAALRSAGVRLGSADGHFSDPLVGALSHLPRLGEPFTSARGLSSAANLAVTSALLPLLDKAGVDPAARLVRGGGAVDVDYLASLAAPTRNAVAVLRRAQQAVSETPPHSGVGQLDAARTELAAKLGRLKAVLADGALATRLGPQLLGATRPQHFLLVSQSPAEARGTGGLVGGYSLLEVDRGKVRLVRSAPKRALQSPGTPVVQLGPEYDEHYGAAGPTLGWINSNISPHYPYAARIWKALFERQFPERLDGVLVLDPVALSYLMRATGPVTLNDGTVVTADSIASLTMRDVYAKIASDPVRDVYLQQVSSRITAALTSGTVRPRPLVTALSRAVSERRLLLWTPDPAVDAALADQPLAGRIPSGRRVVGDDIVDTGGSKLDFYLDRRLAYVEGCGRPSTVTLRLRNGAPATGLPDYVTPMIFRGGAKAGTNRLLATLHLPMGSRINAVALDGVTFGGLRSGTELNTVWVEYPMDVAPQQTRELVVTFTEPASAAAAPVARLAQPLVRPEAFSASLCRR